FFRGYGTLEFGFRKKEALRSISPRIFLTNLLCLYLIKPKMIMFAYNEEASNMLINAMGKAEHMIALFIVRVFFINCLFMIKGTFYQLIIALTPTQMSNDVTTQCIEREIIFLGGGFLCFLLYLSYVFGSENKADSDSEGCDGQNYRLLFLDHFIYSKTTAIFLVAIHCPMQSLDRGVNFVIAAVLRPFFYSKTTAILLATQLLLHELSQDTRDVKMIYRLDQYRCRDFFLQMMIYRCVSIDLHFPCLGKMKRAISIQRYSSTSENPGQKYAFWFSIYDRS
ncbi:hypothetical protein ACJX0J_024563, partial [Zea mays]